MPSSPAPRYAGLDGLRAVAVLLVVVYHLFPSAFLHSGFVGVDAFFVISGFLITSLLLRERAATGRIALRAFWVRRARRLLPALALVVTVSASAAWLVGGDVLVGLGRQVLGAATFSYNWLSIAAGTSYFSAGMAGGQPELPGKRCGRSPSKSSSMSCGPCCCHSCCSCAAASPVSPSRSRWRPARRCGQSPRKRPARASLAPTSAPTRTRSASCSESPSRSRSPASPPPPPPPPPRVHSFAPKVHSFAPQRAASPRRSPRSESSRSRRSSSSPRGPAARRTIRWCRSRHPSPRPSSSPRPFTRHRRSERRWTSRRCAGS
ncbi:MAG: acyltransferase [Microbacterium sp.]